MLKRNNKKRKCPEPKDYYSEDNKSIYTDNCMHSLSNQNSSVNMQ
jgi:hypothetical protein